MITPLSSGAATAEDTYTETCAICHGADGAGQTARGKKLKLKDLRSPEVQKLTDQYIAKLDAHLAAKEKEIMTV